MLEEQRGWQGSAEGAEWQRKRGALPVVQIRRGLLDALADHDVAVVGGDTGCGKTTQVQPLFLSRHPPDADLHACMHACRWRWIVAIPACMHSQHTSAAHFHPLSALHGCCACPAATHFPGCNITSASRRSRACALPSFRRCPSSCWMRRWRPAAAAAAASCARSRGASRPFRWRSASRPSAASARPAAPARAWGARTHPQTLALLPLFTASFHDLSSPQS